MENTKPTEKSSESNIGKNMRKVLLVALLSLTSLVAKSAEGGKANEASALKLPPHPTEAQFKAYMDAKKKADTTPKINMAEELRAINAGKTGGMSAEQAAKLSTANEAGWEKHVNEMGYEKVVKN